MASKPLSVTNRDLINIQRGLKALDGHQGKDGVVRFDFDASLVWSAARNMTLVETAIAAFEKAKKSLGAQQGIVDGQRLTEENAPRVAKFLEQVEELKGKSVTISGIELLSRKALQKGGLNLPNVFADLMLIIEDK